jgi:NitT/TauT family transport system permease protein
MKYLRFLPPILSFIIISLLLEVLVQKNILSSLLVPAPSQVLNVLFESADDFKTAFFETSSSVLQGYVLSIGLGLLIALAFSLSTYARRSILPFAIFFQTVPIIAVAPLLVIYFGFGQPTVIAATLIVSIFPIIANTLVGLDNIDKNYLDLFKIYHANRWQTLFKLKIPLAYLPIYSGIKISAGLAVIGAVAGEFVAGGGLGALIDSARTQQRVDIVFAAILLLSLLGLAIIFLINLIHFLIQKWRPLAPNIRSPL